jgi:hypothetical protein
MKKIGRTIKMKEKEFEIVIKYKGKSLKRKDIKSDADWIEETIMETLYENFEADVKACVSFREVK